VTSRRGEGIGSYNRRRIYEGIGGSGSTSIGIGNGDKIGSLQEVSNIFGALSREPSKGVGSSTPGDGKIDYAIVCCHTSGVGKYGTHRKEVGLSKYGGKGIDASKVVGYGNKVGTCGNVYKVLCTLVIGPKIREGSVSGYDR
jgi:hypothetical protein